MSAPTAPMIAPSEPEPQPKDAVDVVMTDAPAEPTSTEPAQAPDSPLSQLSHVTSDIISNNHDHDSEAETDIASTNNTPVKTRTRPGLHYSLDSDGGLPGRSPEKSSFLSQATAALARKRKAGEEASEGRRSRSPAPPSASSEIASKRTRLSPEVKRASSVGQTTGTGTDGSERGSRAGTPSERPSNNHLVQTRSHLHSDGSRAKTEPRMRSSSPARTSHRRSSSFHAAAAAAATADRERRTRNRTSLESGSNDNTPAPGRLRQPEITPVQSPIAPMAKNKDSTGRTKLAQACDKGHIEKVEEMLKTATQEYINEPDYAETSPIQMASLKGHVKIVELLIQAGANIDVANREGDTPLIDAVQNSQADVVALLLKSNVDPWRANNRGDRAQDLINDDEEQDRITALLKEACDAWIERNHGQIPHAARPQAPKTRSLLYVEPNLKNLRDFAEDGDKEGIIYMNNCRITPDNSCLVAAARGGHVEAMAEMLEYASEWQLPYDPDPESVDGETPMLAAIERGNVDVIQKLLEWDRKRFDARRKVNGKAYYEIIESMTFKPPGWEEGFRLLKDAYEDQGRGLAQDRSPEPPRRRRIITGKQRNEGAGIKADDDPRSPDSTSRRIKSEMKSEEPRSASGSDSTYDELQRQIAIEKEKIRVREERHAKQAAKTNLEIQAKAETQAQEEAKQRAADEKAARDAKKDKSREVQQKLLAEARKRKEAKEEAARKEEEALRQVEEATELARQKEEEAKAAALRQEEEAKDAARKKEEEAKEEARRKQEEAREEARRKEQARIEEEIARRKAAEKEAQEQADRERREEEERAAELARKKAEEDALKLKAEEEARSKAEEEARLKAEVEARERALEERKEYLARLPRALSRALQPEHVIEPEHLARPQGRHQRNDHLHTLNNQWQPIPLFRGSDIAADDDFDDEVYIPGFFASVYLRHPRLDTVQTELNWSVLPCTRAQRSILWNRAGISHRLVKDHDWAVAPLDIRRDSGVHVEVDIVGMPQVDWADLYDEGQKKWLGIEGAVWVRLEDFINETRNKEWLRGVELRTSAWCQLSAKSQAPPPRAPTYVNGMEILGR